MPTPKELARIYADTINAPADGWGQHCHPVYGASHWIWLQLANAVGSDEAARLIDLASKPDWTCHWCGVRNNNDAVSCIHCNGG